MPMPSDVEDEVATESEASEGGAHCQAPGNHYWKHGGELEGDGSGEAEVNEKRGVEAQVTTFWKP